MNRRTARTTRDPGAPTPRDVETLELIVAALDEGVTGEVDAHAKVVGTLVTALGFSYGSVWLPDTGGRVALAVEVGDLASAMSTV